MTVVCVQKNDCVWYCVQRPQFHLLFNNEHNTKYILFVESRHCTVKLKISFFLPNDAALISICNPSSEKGKLPLLVCWRLTPFQMYFVWLFLNGSSLMYCVKTSRLPAPYLVWLKQWVQHSMMEKGQIEQMIQRWDEDKCMCLLRGAWVNFCEVFIRNKL